MRALAELRARVGEGARVRLVVAGGYDVRVRENVEHLRELQQLVGAALAFGREGVLCAATQYRPMWPL